jgi:hypothetical protein
VTHTLTDVTWWHDLVTAMGVRRLPAFFVRDLAKAAGEGVSRRGLWRLHRYAWLVRPYKVSIVILKRH